MMLFKNSLFVSGIHFLFFRYVFVKYPNMIANIIEVIITPNKYLKSDGKSWPEIPRKKNIKNPIIKSIFCNFIKYAPKINFNNRINEDACFQMNLNPNNCDSANL